MASKLNITATLNNGIDIPILGLGTFRIPEGAQARDICATALSLGYRHIDTASIYANERSVGEAIRQSDIPRSEIFVTTKVWNTDHGFEAARNACRESLNRLGLDYIDLYLVHWPVSGARSETWKALESLLAEGLVRAIGVSNYMVHHLEELLGQCEVAPSVNQIELHPFNYLFRLDIVELCRKHNILVESFCPLVQGRRLDHPLLIEMAHLYEKTPAQLLIRWGLDHGFAVIPKSVRPDRIEQNADVFDFSLSAGDLHALDALNEDLITSWDPTNAP